MDAAWQALGAVCTAACPADAAVALAEAAADAVRGCLTFSTAGAMATSATGSPPGTAGAAPPEGGEGEGDLTLEALLRAALPVLLEGGEEAPAVERFVARLLCRHPSLVRCGTPGPCDGGLQIAAPLLNCPHF